MSLSELHDALRARLDIVADHDLRANDPALQLQKLREAALRLQETYSEIQSQLDPRLRHYIERQSYQKALAWFDEHGAG